MSSLVFMRGNGIDTSLTDLIEYTGLSDIKMVEIGSFRGESAAAFMSTSKVSEITCIDPWPENYSEVAHAETMASVEEDFDSRLVQYGSKVKKLKGTSDDVHSLIPDNSIDLLYVDGIHQYLNVKEDLKNYIPKVKVGGFICGHDFTDEWHGVKSVVRESIGEPEKLFPDSSWVIRKV